MHHHCVFEDRGPNCSAHRLKRRPLIMLATSCWRPQTYASARSDAKASRDAPAVFRASRGSKLAGAHLSWALRSSGSVFSTLAS